MTDSAMEQCAITLAAMLVKGEIEANDYRSDDYENITLHFGKHYFKILEAFNEIKDE